MHLRRCLRFCVFAASLSAGVCDGQVPSGLQPADYQRLRAVVQAEFSPDAKFIAYTVLRYDHPGRPWPQLWVMDLATAKSKRVGGENDVAGSPVWSPDG